MITSDLGYFELTAAEFSEQCEAVGYPPVLFERWADVNKASGLRVIRSGLLPWTHKGVEIHACAWPNGQCMISPAIWATLKA